MVAGRKQHRMGMLPDSGIQPTQSVSELKSFANGYAYGAPPTPADFFKYISFPILTVVWRPPLDSVGSQSLLGYVGGVSDLGALVRNDRETAGRPMNRNVHGISSPLSKG